MYTPLVNHNITVATAKLNLLKIKFIRLNSIPKTSIDALSL